jgi:hypothetical protein
MGRQAIETWKNKQATVTRGSKGPGLAIVEAAFGARSGGSFAFRAGRHGPLVVLLRHQGNLKWL